MAALEVLTVDPAAAEAARLTVPQTGDTYLMPRTLEIRNDTTAMKAEIYNTYTDASNYERGVFSWNSNVLELFTEKSGTGTLRGLKVGNSSAYFFAISSSALAVITNTTDIRFFNAAMYPATNNTHSIGTTSFKWNAAYLNKISTPDAGELTIATGAVTATGGFHTIDTEGDAASDDLDTINGGVDGMHLTIMAEDGARTVVAKDGTGNLQLSGDCTLDNAQDTLTLLYVAALSAWVEISRSDNGA